MAAHFSTGPAAAMTLLDPSGRQGWLVICGDQFMYMCNNLQQSPNSEIPEISMGHIQRGTAPWEIQLSTQPWKEGSCLWKPEDITIDEQHWQIIQETGEGTLAWAVQEWGALTSLFKPVHRPKSEPGSVSEPEADETLFLTCS